MKSHFYLAALFMSLLLTAVAVAADPAEKSALELMPASTIFYAEMTAPARLLDTILDHPLTAQVTSHPDYEKAIDTPDMQHLRKVIELIEAKLGTEWRPALSTLAGGGIYFGIDLATAPGALIGKQEVPFVVLVHSNDEELLAKARATFVELVQQQARDEGNEDPVKPGEYKGVSTYQLDKAHVATFDSWLVISNHAMLSRMVIDNSLGQGSGSLGEEKQFLQARDTRPGEPTVWTYLDMRLLRATGIAKAAFEKKSDNPGLELLVGGILGAIPEAPYVTASLDIAPDHVRVSTAFPYDTSKVADKREFYFGPEGKGVAPELLLPKQTIFTLSTYRDFGAMWQRAPDLFDDNINAQFAQAESGLATLFGGRSFGDDILARLEPGMQIVVARQDFSKAEIVPAIKLPAAAVVVRIKDPKTTARQFKITYQSLVGFLNIAGGMNALEPLEQNVEELGDILVASAEYLPPTDEAKRQAAPAYFNASPSVAFVEDKFIIASTRGLAVELAEHFDQHDDQPAEGVNTQLNLDVGVLRDVLADNRGQLVAQNMLDKGHDAAAAESEIDLLLKLLQSLEESSLALTTKDKLLRLSWEVKLQ